MTADFIKLFEQILSTISKYSPTERIKREVELITAIHSSKSKASEKNRGIYQ